MTELKEIKLKTDVNKRYYKDYITYIENHPYLDEMFYYKLSTLSNFDINQKCEKEIFKELA